MLGGTFNPPHVGHLRVARHARDELGLDRVLLVPVDTPPHKASADDPGAEHRLAMVRLLAEEEPWLDASEIELERGGLSYTADTLRELHARDPETTLTLIVGADMARTLPGWREPEEILGLARLAVAEREGSARDEISQALTPLIGCHAVNGDDGGEGARREGRIVFLDMPEVPVSSTMVREAARAGGSIEELVTGPVAEYIRRNGLYGAPQPEGFSR